MYEVVAIIPARGGSKGIPRKNVLPLAGKPLVAHSIEAARQARLVTRVVVSTDDAEIGAVARQFGAEVVWRPSEISGDLASSESALLHVLETLRTAEGYVPDLVVFLQCTSPLTQAEDIDGTVQALLDANADTALAVVPFHYFVWRQVQNGGAEGINHDKSVRLMRQQREPQYLEAGAVYVMRMPQFAEVGHRFFGSTALYVMPSERRWEIDEPVDFHIGEMLLREQNACHRLASLPQKIGGVVLDFDGVFTDNRVWVMEDGREMVACNRSDGLGLERLKALGVPILVLSGEVNPVVGMRCAKLGLECLQGVAQKREALDAWRAQHDLAMEDLIYVGNDVNDLECLRLVGCGIVVSDAHPDVISAARVVLSSSGGHGALRELCDLIHQHVKGYHYVTNHPSR